MLRRVRKSRYSLSAPTLSHPTHDASVSVEATLVHAAKDRLSGADDPNSGGTTLFLSPGLQYVTKKWIAEAGVQIPVSQSLNGTALKNAYTLNAGVRISF